MTQTTTPKQPKIDHLLPENATCYLVGGAVRDSLLGYPFSERDWVVVGATPDGMLSQGFEQVGKDFPVFLHPVTKDEYALARTERKSGTGYYGFACDIANVSLEDDLLRRDLTLNAIAQANDGQLIDPYGGQDDIENRLLRHISPAFSEDPLRVLRVARFAARYHHLGFRIADETIKLMRDINDSGELTQLTAERVWKELASALMERRPAVFFQTLLDCGALKTLFPEIYQMHGVPQPAQYHPEVDCFVHLCLCLNVSAALNHDLPTRYAVLMHDLGKGTTPKSELPRHIAHEARSEKLAKTFSKRIKAPNDCAQLGMMTGKWHTHIHRALELKPQTLLKLFRGTDAYRRPERFVQMLDACIADSRGRTGYENNPYPQKDYAHGALNAASTIDTQALLAQGYTGAKLGEAIERQRLRQVTAYKAEYLANAEPA